MKQNEKHQFSFILQKLNAYRIYKVNKTILNEINKTQETNEHKKIIELLRYWMQNTISRKNELNKKKKTHTQIKSKVLYISLKTINKSNSTSIYVKYIFGDARSEYRMHITFTNCLTAYLKEQEKKSKWVENNKEKKLSQTYSTHINLYNIK